MLSYDGLGLNEDQGRSPPPPGGRQDHPEYAVAGAEMRPLHGTLQGPQLVSEGNIFETMSWCPRQVRAIARKSHTISSSTARS
jgi:hypothetical protein